MIALDIEKVSKHFYIRDEDKKKSFFALKKKSYWIIVLYK